MFLLFSSMLNFGCILVFYSYHVMLRSMQPTMQCTDICFAGLHYYIHGLRLTDLSCHLCCDILSIIVIGGLYGGNHFFF